MAEWAELASRLRKDPCKNPGEGDPREWLKLTQIKDQSH